MQKTAQAARDDHCAHGSEAVTELADDDAEEAAARAGGRMEPNAASLEEMRSINKEGTFPVMVAVEVALDEAIVEADADEVAIT